MEKKKCFVIMPFSKTTDKHDEKYWTAFFDIIKKVMKEKNYDCIRSEVGPYSLFNNIVRNIEESSIVIAVLTDFNANVWYELGIRHTLKVGTIMLLQKGQVVPFDIRNYGVIFYEDSINLEGYINDRITEYLSKMDDNTCDSPVIASLSSRTYDRRANSAVEKKLEEMEQLIWKIINEIPRNRNVENTSKVIHNRILWVDDNPGNNEMVINLFTDKNIQFDIAISTEQGIELFKRNLYDIIITDMGRGEENDAGLTLIKRLKYLRCQVPIIVFSSRRAIQNYGDAALCLGACDVIYGVRDIIFVIADILELEV